MGINLKVSGDFMGLYVLFFSVGTDSYNNFIIVCVVCITTLMTAERYYSDSFNYHYISVDRDSIKDRSRLLL